MKGYGVYSMPHLSSANVFPAQRICQGFESIGRCSTSRVTPDSHADSGLGRPRLVGMPHCAVVKEDKCHEPILNNATITHFAGNVLLACEATISARKTGHRQHHVAPATLVSAAGAFRSWPLARPSLHPVYDKEVSSLSADRESLISQNFVPRLLGADGTFKPLDLEH